MAKVVFLLDDDEVGETEVKLMGIKAVDEEFRYSIYKGKDKFILVVRCGSKDEAYRKAMWLRDKVFDNKKLFKVYL